MVTIYRYPGLLEPPPGYISIRAVVENLHEALHPGEEQQAKAALLHQRSPDEKLPAAYHQHDVHRKEVEELILTALATDTALQAVFSYNDRVLPVPGDYWTTADARSGTLSTSELVTRNLDWKGMQLYDGILCFVEQTRFLLWAEGVVGRLQPERTDVSSSLAHNLASSVPSTLPTIQEHELSPYLRMMIDVARDLKISREHQPTKEALITEFKGRWRKSHGEKLSGNLSNAMATLIREPDSQLGRAAPKKHRG